MYSTKNKKMCVCCIKQGRSVIKRTKLTQTLLHAIAQHSMIQNQGCSDSYKTSYFSYQERQEGYEGTYFGVMIILNMTVLLVEGLCTELVGIHPIFLMEGSAWPEAAQRTMEANVFELTCTTMFLGNVCVIQASEQLHCWARCVQKSLQTNS